MKGDAKVIEFLNQVLKAELTAINQYFLHAEMCENWSYERLAKLIRKESIEEMQHAEKLMERILYLDGTPNMSDYFKINIGQTVEQQYKNDLQLEYEAVKRRPGSPLRVAAVMANRELAKKSSPTKNITSTGLRRNCTRSARWATRTTWRNS
jgi:bacterioferritin